MSVTFHIEERVDGVIVSVSEPGKYGRVALGAFFSSVVAYLFVRFATSRAFQTLICLFIAFGVVKPSRRGPMVERLMTSYGASDGMPAGFCV